MHCFIGLIVGKQLFVFQWEKPDSLIIFITLTPVENYLKGSYVHLSFETTCDQENVVYMTSSYLNYAITIEPQGDMLRVVSVQNLTE